jgi:hypothetical protein
MVPPVKIFYPDEAPPRQSVHVVHTVLARYSRTRPALANILSVGGPPSISLGWLDQIVGYPEGLPSPRPWSWRDVPEARSAARRNVA